MFKVIAFLAVLALAFCQENTNEVDNIIDQIIENRRDDLKNLKTPGFKQNIDVPLSAVDAVVELKEGPITGLESLCRVEGSKVRKTADGLEEYTVLLGAEQVNVNTTGSISYRLLNWAVDYHAKVDAVALTAVLLKNPSNNHRVLRSLKITKFENFQVSIDGPGMVADALWNAALRVTRVAYEPVLKLAIEQGLKYYVDKEIEDRNKISG